MAVAKDQIRQIITENNITSVADVYSLLKDSFKDILQELLKPRWTQLWVMKKIVRVILKATIKGTVIPSKTLKKPVTGEFQIDVPRDRNGEFEPS